MAAGLAQPDRLEPLEELRRYHEWIWSLPEPKGLQEPRIRIRPPRVDDSLAPEAVELAAAAGLLLDPWQITALDDCMARRFDGPEQWGGIQWAAFSFGEVVSRQNGKGGWLEARELHGLFIGREELIIHTAHKFDTSAEAFRRIRGLIKNTEELEREVVRESNSHGKEGIELRDGTRLLFKARSGGAARGFSADLLVWDEAMFLDSDPVASMLPALSARTDPQVIYTGSAGFPTSLAFGRLRRRCLKQAKKIAALVSMGMPVPPDVVERIAWHEHSVDEEAYRQRKLDPSDPKVWGFGNPAMGYRILVETIRSEMGEMGGAWSPEFGRERLGVGDWPQDDDELPWRVIGKETWEALSDPYSLAEQKRGQLGVSVEMAMDRSATCIGLAGVREDGRYHLQIGVKDQVDDYRTGPPDWVIDRGIELVKRWRPAGGIAIHDHGPAQSLIPEFERRGVTVRKLTSTELAAGYGLLMDKIKAGQVRHVGQDALTQAVGGSANRSVGTSTAWDMKEASSDSSPLCAVTNALHVLHTSPRTGWFGASYR